MLTLLATLSSPALAGLPTWSSAVPPLVADDRSVLQILREPHDLVGLQLRMGERGVEVVESVPGSPAWMAGIGAGSLIVQVDGAYVVRLTLREVVERIREAPSPVQLGLLHGQEIRGVQVHKLPSWACYRVWSEEAAPGLVDAVKGAYRRIQCPEWAMSWLGEGLLKD